MKMLIFAKNFMNFMIKGQSVEARTLAELRNKLNSCNIEHFDITHYKTNDELLLFYSGSNNILCKLLTSSFDIPTYNNFANRSAINLCTNCVPNKHYIAKTQPTFAEYILSMLRITSYFILHVYLSNKPIFNSGWVQFKKIKVNEDQILNDILLKVDIPRTHNILRFSYQPLYSGPETKYSIEIFLKQNGIIDTLSGRLTEEVIDELNLEEFDFNLSLMKSIAPTTSAGWYFLQSHFAVKGIKL